jgi:hypothetical protein
MRKNGYLGRVFLAIFLGLFNVNYALASEDTLKIVFYQDSNIQQFRGVEWHRIAHKNTKRKLFQSNIAN